MMDLIHGLQLRTNPTQLRSISALYIAFEHFILNLVHKASLSNGKIYKK